MPSFAKNMEICEVLPKIWDYMKFCQKYKVMCQFYQIYGIMPSFAKNIKLCFNFFNPNLWSFVKFCQKYKVMF
jgi:hypothetical protein